MNTYLPSLKNAIIGAGAACTVLMMASCTTTPRTSSPQQVAESNPTVTYSYRNDDELIQAGQRAVIYCNQQQTRSQSVAESFQTTTGGDNTVTFECVPESSGPTTTRSPQTSSDLSYSFRTDQELLNASKEAQRYCMGQGSAEVISEIVTQSDGSKSVTFRCSR